MLPVRCRFTDKCWNIYERRWMANSNNSLSRGNWPLKKKRWAWNFGTFSAWSVKHGNSEGNSVSVKLGFALESKRKKLWPTRARAITINIFYTASPNQTQSCSFSTFLWLQMIPKIIKLAYVIAESSNYTFYTRGFLTIAALCPFPGFALGILP